MQDCTSNNHRLNVGGFISFSHSNDAVVVLQVIEGPSAVVNQLFARIKEDNRHTTIQQLYSIQIEQRALQVFGTAYIDETRWRQECSDELLVRLTFGSVLAAGTLAQAQDITQGIAESSIQKFPAHSVTGCFFVNRYTRRAVHVLEGPASTVHQLYGQISTQRLKHCTVLGIKAIALRHYRCSYMLVEGLRATWSMAEHTNDMTLLKTIGHLMAPPQPNTQNMQLHNRSSAIKQTQKSPVRALTPPPRLPSSLPLLPTPLLVTRAKSVVSSPLPNGTTIYQTTDQSLAFKSD
eukprot:CAMPEP_0119315928 /NCGR_PEP_ID=MMETSP1333-20130426/37779_1 /TAXON_ID=418940 /ORGANISM="Scyphosphaera apsteinii, Strain RCC1455" /LENGTH=291 /DNA_ID=CAMNT_0007321433 /DNA_START=218 /DNA_END=1093 /DNA_ORIENTATION=+